jgi:hypothetical protein
MHSHVVACPLLQQCTAVRLVVYDSARANVRLCGIAAVCGSAAVRECTAVRQCMCGSATVCGSTAMCGSVRGCVRQCMRQYTGQCVALYGSARGNVWQCTLCIDTQSRPQCIYWYAIIQGTVGLSHIFLGYQF